jgi:F-type H+-transporting ATPase subunit delta
MSTFIGQLIGFAVIVGIIWKYVVPPVRKLMAAQQETVRTQLAESAKASSRLADADKHHAKRVEQAKAEAKHVVEEARVDAERIAEQLRLHADAEAERIKSQGGQQVELLRAQLVRQLRQELGAESVRRAEELVRQHVSDPEARSATVDRFIDELDSMAPAPFAPEVTSDLRSASRGAQAALVERFDSVAAGLSGEALSTQSDELAAVAKLLVAEPILARHLADTTGSAEAKKQLLHRLLGSRVGPNTLDVLGTAVSARWSTTGDFAAAIGHIARLSLLSRAERDGQAGDVEEQLFRFSRILDAEPRLSTLLSDYTTPAAGRVALLRDVLSRSSATNPVVEALLVQTVELLHGQRADVAVAQLVQLAVSRRGEIIAQVSAAAELTGSQRNRLTDVLTRIYNRPISVQLNVDPSLLGGLSVAVGDEVIDGTLASRLAAAKTKLPD